jgi:hypothetical protein
MSPLLDGTTFCSSCSKVLWLGAYDPSYDKLDNYREREEEAKFGVLHLVDDMDFITLLMELVKRRGPATTENLLDALNS